MLVNPGKFYGGVLLMIAFAVVLVVMFMPVFAGQNFLNYMDSLYNSISKGSADYIAELEQVAKTYRERPVILTLAMGSEVQAGETAPLLERGGAEVGASSATLTVNGDLGRILAACLNDSGDMFANDGHTVTERYGYEAKRVLFNWWSALKAADRNLKKQGLFAEAAFVTTVKKKAVECAYNYHGIEAQEITSKLGIVFFSLIFYVLYTVWYGYAIIFMFEGWGLRLSH